MKKILRNDLLATKHQYHCFKFQNQKYLVFDGCGRAIDGDKKVAHLMIIQNCGNSLIQNTIFRNGNTAIVSKVEKAQFCFPQNKISIFEVIDGGGVIVTGNSNVTFRNCTFVDNYSIMCGGAVSNQSTGLVKFENCIFENNTAGHTGSAVDNLTKKSNLKICNCRFINNVSNEWHKQGFPHGQVTAFANTKLLISNSVFQNGSIPFDVESSTVLYLQDNVYDLYENWSEDTVLKRKYSLYNWFLAIVKMFNIVLKIYPNVYFKIRNN
jgi:hypothetical protein